MRLLIEIEQSNYTYIFLREVDDKVIRMIRIPEVIAKYWLDYEPHKNLHRISIEK